MSLRNKNIILAITGSISAYKAVELASYLVQQGAKVHVIMTKAATHFIAPLTLRTITGQAVITDLFSESNTSGTTHVSLTENADIIVIAPATANTIAKLAAGIADDIVSCTILAHNKSIILSPAMNVRMFENSVTQENLQKLSNRGFTIVEPEYGRLASGLVGKGRLASIDAIVGAICRELAKNGDLSGKRIMVTAGATQEAIDPVRFITNRSSGKMGYAIAVAARDRGADVILITAPTALNKPYGVNTVQVTNSSEMYDQVKNMADEIDALIMAAAVSDYKPVSTEPNKIKKSSNILDLKLESTIDILSNVSGNFIKIGFAAESDNLIANALDKLKRKKLNFIVANDITSTDSGFGSDFNRASIIDKDGSVDELPLLSKRELADKILDKLLLAINNI
jgi:phosphopantothenoylcysteine decarboxylase/phosphopantothenate--cysteine ligase